MSVPECITRWGTFVASDESHRKMHPLAPPSHVCGSRLPAPLLTEDSHVSKLLLEQLSACQADDEETVWHYIEETIEPLSVLRATVCSWRDSDPTSDWKSAAAENALLLLDPAVTAEIFPIALRKGPKSDLTIHLNGRISANSFSSPKDRAFRVSLLRPHAWTSACPLLRVCRSDKCATCQHGLRMRAAF